MRITINRIEMDLADLFLERVDDSLAKELGQPIEDSAIGWWFFGDSAYGISVGILGRMHFEGRVLLGPLVPRQDAVTEMDNYFYATLQFPTAWDTGIQVGDPVIVPTLEDDKVSVPILGLVQDIVKNWASVRTPDGMVADYRLREIRIPMANIKK